MSRTSLFRRVAGSLALSAAAAVLTPTVARADLTFTLGGADFSGGTDNIGGTITVLIHDVSAGVVQLMITNNLADAGGFLGDLYLNTTAAPLTGAVGSCISCAAINNVTPTFSFGSNAFQAAGDGLYDILAAFSNANADRLTPGESITLQINSTSGAAFNAASFNTLSAPGPGGGAGPFLVAAHIQGLNNQGSDWITTTTATPEPGSIILMATGLIGLAVRRRQMKKNAA